MYHYTDHDIARMYHEPAKRSMLVSHQDERGPFARDRARVLHSAALRSLADKTQVVSPKEGDTPRTRLTHSLEVAQIARGIGAGLGLDPNLCEMAGLTHDIGHPPYGHNGEHALNELAVHCGGFEGNAQTLRILTRLEPKVLDERDHSYGLNLTRAGLDAACKYPVTKTNPDGTTNRKYSCYDEDRQILEWVRDGHTDGRAAMEAQVMDFADDIAYSVHDVEDAIATGKLAPGQLRDDARASAVIDSTLGWYGPAVSGADLEEALGALLAMEDWLGDYDAGYAARCRLKDLTSELIGRFCSATVRATRDAFGPEPLGRYRADLVVPRATRAQIQVLKGMAVHYVMSPRESEPVYYQQRTLVADLVDALYEAGADALEPVFAQQWRAASSDDVRLRAVIDQVASLTDVSASAWHARHCGMLSSQL